MAAAQTLSLNQIVSLFKQLSEESLMLNDFGFGNTFDLNSKLNTQYPLLWVEPSQSESMLTPQNGYREFHLGLNLYVLDRVNKGDSNYQEILSDTLYTISTIISQIDQSIKYWVINASFSGNIIFTPFMYEFDDNLNGYKAAIKIKVPLTYSPCNNPILSPPTTTTSTTTTTTTVV